MTAVRIPPCPQGSVEQAPMGPGELVRWVYRNPTGSLTLTLRMRRDERVVQFWTGPGSAMPDTTHPGDLWAICGLLEAASGWLLGDPTPRPEPVDQPSLFDAEVDHA